MASAFTFLISSCQKDEIKSTPPDPEYGMYYKILSFLEEKDGKPLTHPTLTTRTTYSPGDILDYVEGGRNLQYASNRPTWTTYDVRIDTFTIPLSSGYASQQNLEDLYDKIVDTASVHFYGINETDKFPYLFDAISIAYSTSLMTLSVTSSVGKGYRDLTPFGSTDYWDVSGGKCGPYSGGTDNAQDVMNDALNNYYLPYGCVFYTNVTYVSSELEELGWSSLNTSDPIPDDFSIDYRTFIVFCDDEELDPEDPCYSDTRPACSELDFAEIDCLTPSELNYYFGSIRSIYYTYHSNTGLNHISSNIYMEYGLCSYLLHFWAPSSLFGTQNSCLSEEYPTYLPPCC
jgi:hypothetical protein